MGLFAKKPYEEVEETPVNNLQPQQSIPQQNVPAAAATQEIVNTYLDEMGIIAGGTTIHGDVATKGHLAIVGVVEGNVKTAGNLMLTGIVKGNIECNNIVIDGTDFNQSIKAKGSVSIKENSVVNGPINCKHISVLGTVVGNIKASGNVGITKTSIIKGDINAQVLAVEPGAKIQGMITVK